MKNSKLVKKRKSFYNQATIIMDYIKSINLKLFRNGSIHITGIIDVEQGKSAVRFLCDEIRAVYEKDPTITNDDILSTKIDDYISSLYEKTDKTMDYNIFYITKLIDYQILDTIFYKEYLNDSNVGYVPTYPLYCNLNQCITSLNNQYLYLDNNHLSLEGSKLLSDSISNIFKDTKSNK
jgi:hypothetical protein